MSEIDECTDRLVTAMRLLEMQLAELQMNTQRATATMHIVHELVQRAWHLHAGHANPKPISENTLILLATLAAQDAIDDARGI
ncbi:hypothetical protein [Pseudaquabacterium pictum]|uniref:Uncharacterized protein n=1 Tax=Pseudaquabacterium pictum TaxID=2315236 RepID=A0A480AMD0_9BURK|nr:hypothetical protein [Rubrivivax pictus]GCL61527.1 hypothetical protein AQPW35_06080 [Rubrivivax pictus]